MPARAYWITVCWLALAAGALAGQLKVRVEDRESGRPLACRMHLSDAAGRTRKSPQTLAWGDHFVFDGQTTLTLPNGQYRFEIECGPEYALRSGHFAIGPDADDAKTVDMKRVVDMASEGWWSGDLYVSRPEKDLALLMRAEDLHLVQVVNLPARAGGKAASASGAPNAEQLADGAFRQTGGEPGFYSGGKLLAARPSSAVGALDPRAGVGGLLDWASAARRQRQAWIDALRPDSWDFPVWVAAGLVDSVAVASPALERRGVTAADPACRPRDPKRFPGTEGAGRWPIEIYYHLLNCGLRLPPSGASGSGLGPNPPGYNRIYVHLDGAFSPDAWWEGFRAGRVVVTNGPLLRTSVEGERPGHVFAVDAGQTLELEIGLTLSTRERISYLEVVHNGRPAQTYRLDDWARLGGKLRPLAASQSGWFLIRAVTETPGTYRFATSAPYYIEAGYQRRISRLSVQFFLDWIDERVRQLSVAGDPSRRQLEAYDAARRYWQALLAKANAE